MHPIISRELRRFLLLVPLAVAALAFGAWTWWAEQHPAQERDLRILVQERLQNWFPEQMALPDGQFGFMPRSAAHLRLGRPSVILIATPNHGSDWARLRVWLELRELLATLPERRFTLFRALRDGTGAAKIDLRPDSAFLLELNARAWPDQVPRHLIGGLLGEPTPAMKQSIEALSNELGSAELVAALQSWWLEIGEGLGEGLGDGAVPLASLPLEDGPAPVIVPASHRGLLVPTPLTDDRPPAVPLVVQAIEEWLAEQRPTQPSTHPGGAQ
jgi:hypothetical protein